MQIPTRAASLTAILSLGTIFLICKRRNDYQRRRIALLEQQVALARLHHELNEKRLAKLLEAVLDLRATTAGELGKLRNGISRLLAERSVNSRRSAA